MKDLFINELSLIDLHDSEKRVCDDEKDVIRLLSELVATVRAGEHIALVKAFRFLPEALHVEVAARYTVTHWLGDPRASREERQFFRRRATMLPYVVPPDQEILFQGRTTRGVAAAYLGAAVLLSLRTNELWESPCLEVELSELNHTGDLISRVVSVPQVAGSAHWADHRKQMVEEQASQMTTGVALLSYAGLVLPHLEFCDSARRQMTCLNGHERYFKWIRDSLLRAEEEAEAWLGGEFPHSRLPGPATGESTSVQNDDRLRSMRLFRTPQGETIFFQHHMKNHAENKRIYYRFDSVRQKLSVAYVGDHLETANF